MDGNNEKNGSEIITETKQEIPICGVPYSFRRLTVADVFKFSKLINKSMKSIGTENVDINDDITFGFVMMAGLAENDKEICEFYGSMIGMTASTFMGQPPEFFSEFIDVMPQQYDLQAFFGAVLKAVKSTGSLWKGQFI